MVRTKIAHTSGTRFENFRKMFKNTFNLCSHIELNTQNPHTIFKMRFIVQNRQKIPKNFRIVRNDGKLEKDFQIFIFYFLYFP